MEKHRMRIVGERTRVRSFSPFYPAFLTAKFISLLMHMLREAASVTAFTTSFRGDIHKDWNRRQIYARLPVLPESSLLKKSSKTGERKIPVIAK